MNYDKLANLKYPELKEIAIEIDLPVKRSKSELFNDIKKTFREYDETLLSGDSRRTEPKHFGGKKARARRQKSFR